MQKLIFLFILIFAITTLIADDPAKAVTNEGFMPDTARGEESLCMLGKASHEQTQD